MATQSHCLPGDIKEIAEALGDDAGAFEGSTVLLCGGAGFLGRYFATLLAHLNESHLAKPCRVIMCDNLITSGQAGRQLATRDPSTRATPPRRGGLAHLVPSTALGARQDSAPPRPGGVGLHGFRFLEHDIITPLALDEPVDYVIQAAGIASPYYYRKYPLETLEVATVGTRRMLEFGLQHPLKGFLFFSSSEIYGDPDPRHVPTPESYRGNISCLGPRACYDESKRLGETLCQIFHERHGVPATIVRPFNVYGPGMQETDYRVLPNFAGRILKQEPLHIYGSGVQTRTFCYVTDAVAGFLKVLLRGRRGEAYNIGNPVPEVSMLDLAKTLEDVVGRPLG
ncbi:MAG: NAD-dependent epimerase/dehydratase family protein, partial [bacterium]